MTDIPGANEETWLEAVAATRDSQRSGLVQHLAVEIGRLVDLEKLETELTVAIESGSELRVPHRLPIAAGKSMAEILALAGNALVEHEYPGIPPVL